MLCWGCFPTSCVGNPVWKTLRVKTQRFSKTNLPVVREEKMNEGSEVKSVVDLLKLTPAKDFWHIDLFVGAAFGLGALYLEICDHQETVRGALSASAPLLAIVIGFSLAAMSFQAAFFDFDYLTAMREAENDPLKAFSGPAWSVVFGVAAAILVLIRLGVPDSSHIGVRIGPGMLAAAMTGVAITSIPSNLTTLITVIRMREIVAAQAEDTDNSAGA